MIAVVRSALLALATGTACGRVGFEALHDGAAADSALADTAMLLCHGLAPTCGPTGTADCCASLLVPGGTFYRSYDVGTDGTWTDMSYPATLADFHLDTYEVTVGRFRQFVDAGMGTQANPPGNGAGARTFNGIPGQGGWDPTWNTNLEADSPTLIASLACSTSQTWTDAPGANESLAMDCMTWFEAFAFCVWDGGFLPTEAQWNYAAVGGNEQRAFPWSTPASSIAIDCTEANFFPGPPCVGLSANGQVARVGSQSPAGDGKWGHADLGGDVWEWVLDWVSVYPTPCDDCADLTSNTVRGFRGGAYDTTATQVRPATRGTAAPTLRDPANGVRCAR
jgi:formylglycine-generating enzyme required for sulfatase activity